MLLQPLDSDKQPIRKGGGHAFASGFIIDGAFDNRFGSYQPATGISHLYTCWHVIAGHDPRNSKTPANYTQPKFLEVTGVSAESPNSILEGRDSFVIPLYNDDGRPLWEQESATKESLDFQALGLHIPKNIDAIRLPVALTPEQKRHWVMQPDRIRSWRFELGEDIFVCGFPNGFSVFEQGPIPVFLKRSVASAFFDPHHITLVDGDCAPVMSGGPVFVREDTRWKVAGMYFGSYFTDKLGNDTQHKKRTALGGVIALNYIQNEIRTVLDGVATKQ